MQIPIVFLSLDKLVTSNFLTNSFAVGADTIMWRAFGLINPSSTALSMNDNKELKYPSTFTNPTYKFGILNQINS